MTDDEDEHSAPSAEGHATKQDAIFKTLKPRRARSMAERWGVDAGYRNAHGEKAEPSWVESYVAPTRSGPPLPPPLTRKTTKPTSGRPPASGSPPKANVAPALHLPPKSGKPSAVVRRAGPPGAAPSWITARAAGREGWSDRRE
jgi:hypothetical protein